MTSDGHSIPRPLDLVGHSVQWTLDMALDTKLTNNKLSTLGTHLEAALFGKFDAQNLM